MVGGGGGGGLYNVHMTLKEQAIIRISSMPISVVHLQDACFTQLRTEEQLGYVVFCFNTINEGISSFQTLIQSETFDPDRVLNSTLSFLTSFYHQTLLSPNFTSSFNESAYVLGQSLGASDVKLTDKTDRLWDEIVSGQLQFNKTDQLLAALGKLDYQGFLQFYNDTILREDSYRRLMIVVYGKGKGFEFDDTLVDYHVDYASLNQTQLTLPTS